MGHFATELPMVIVKPGKMITPNFKVVATVLMVLLYVYLVLFLRTCFLRSERLDHIWDMILETEKQVMEVQKMDQDLGMQIAQLKKLYEVY